MFKCVDCGTIFAEPEEWLLTFGGGEEAPSRVYGCPFCGPSSYYEVERCEVCEEYFEAGKYPTYICPKCQEEVEIYEPI